MGGHMLRRFDAPMLPDSWLRFFCTLSLQLTLSALRKLRLRDAGQHRRVKNMAREIALVAHIGDPGLGGIVPAVVFHLVPPLVWPLL